MTDSRSVLITTGSEPVIEWQVGLMFCEVRKSTVHAVLTTLHAHEQTLFERFLREYASLFDPKHQLPNRFNIVLHRQVLDCLRNWTNERMRDAFERLLADVRLPIGYAPYGLLEDPVEVLRLGHHDPGARVLQQRDDLLIPQSGERVGPGPIGP